MDYKKAFFGEYFFTKMRNDLATPELLSYLDSISHKFPGGWHSGRLDVKVLDDADLGRVKNLGILEINLNTIGCISEKPLLEWNKGEPSLKREHEGVMGVLMPLRRVRTMGVQIFMGLLNLLMANITPTYFITQLPQVIGRAEICQRQYLEHLFGRD